MPERSRFCGGPLQDSREFEIHSLMVHMRGDGRTSIGWYEQIYDDGDCATGTFQWHPARVNETPQPSRKEDPMRQIVPQTEQYIDSCQEILRVLNERGEMAVRDIAEAVATPSAAVTAKLRHLADRGAVTYRTTGPYGGAWSIAQTENE